MFFDFALVIFCATWQEADDASDIFYCPDIHLYSLILPHMPHNKMPLQAFPITGFFVFEDSEKTHFSFRGKARNILQHVADSLQDRNLFCRILSIFTMTEYRKAANDLNKLHAPAVSNCEPIISDSVRSALVVLVSKKRTELLYCRDTRIDGNVDVKAKF